MRTRNEVDGESGLESRLIPAREDLASAESLERSV
jgi:hypothetical protein